MQFIDLNTQYKKLKNKIDARIHKVLDHGKYIMGPEVFELEERLADYVNVKHAVTCANGTDALSLALMAMEVGHGDAVFCPTFTFFASAEAIALTGATPIFVDSDKDTFNISLESLEESILLVLTTGKLNLKAIMAVDLFGLPANYPGLEKVASKYDIKIIEDAAQGFGGAIGEQKAGSFGDIATTSFFPAKPLGCYGDGGAVFTNNDDYAEVIRSLKVHGKGLNKYDNIRIGMNSRLDTIQAAVLLEKLNSFPDELVQRNLAAQHYSLNLSKELTPPKIPEGYKTSWAQYTVRSKDREKSIKKYQQEGIPVMIYYRTCMHQQTAFRDEVGIVQKFPVAEKLAKEVFSLPMHGYLNI